MKKGFFDNIDLNEIKKSLTPKKSLWSWLFLISIVFGTLFVSLQNSSILGEGTHKVTFESGNAKLLENIVDIYKVGLPGKLDADANGIFSTDIPEGEFKFALVPKYPYQLDDIKVKVNEVELPLITDQSDGSQFYKFDVTSDTTVTISTVCSYVTFKGTEPDDFYEKRPGVNVYTGVDGVDPVEAGNGNKFPVRVPNNDPLTFYIGQQHDIVNLYEYRIGIYWENSEGVPTYIGDRDRSLPHQAAGRVEFTIDEVDSDIELTISIKIKYTLTIKAHGDYPPIGQMVNKITDSTGPEAVLNSDQNAFTIDAFIGYESKLSIKMKDGYDGTELAMAWDSGYDRLTITKLPPPADPPAGTTILYGILYTFNNFDNEAASTLLVSKISTKHTITLVKGEGLPAGDLSDLIEVEIQKGPGSAVWDGYEYDLANPIDILGGQTWDFRIKCKESYNQSLGNLKVTMSSATGGDVTGGTLTDWSDLEKEDFKFYVFESHHLSNSIPLSGDVIFTVSKIELNKYKVKFSGENNHSEIFEDMFQEIGLYKYTEGAQSLESLGYIIQGGVPPVAESVYVEHGQKLIIEFALKHPYSKCVDGGNDRSFTLKCGETEFKTTYTGSSSGYRTIRYGYTGAEGSDAIPVTSAMDFVVSGIKINTYKVTFESGSGNHKTKVWDMCHELRVWGTGGNIYINNGNTSAALEHGKQFNIFLTLKREYSQVLEDLGATPLELTLKNADDTVTTFTMERYIYTSPDDLEYYGAKYIIPDITSDMNLIVSGITLNRYDITFASEDCKPDDAVLEDMVKIDAKVTSEETTPPTTTTIVTDIDNYVLTVYHGDKVDFSVERLAAYSESEFTVKRQGVELLPLSPLTYGLGVITDSSAVTISGLRKNIYTVKFENADDTADWLGRIEINPLDPDTTIDPLDPDTTNEFEMEHGANQGFVINAKTGYHLNSIKLELGGAGYDFTPTIPPETGPGGEKYTTEITFSVNDITDDKTFKISDVGFRNYKVTFVDEEGNPIPEYKAEIIQRITEDALNENGLSILWDSSMNFVLNLTTAYENSENDVVLSVPVGSGSLVYKTDETDEKYYEFKFTAPGDAVIKIEGIKINRYECTFSYPDNLGNGELGVAFAKYNNDEDVDKMAQSGDNQSFKLPAPEGEGPESALIPHGKDFTFSIEVVKSEEYGFEFDDKFVGSDITYGEESEDEISPLDKVINAGAISGSLDGLEGSIVYNVNSAQSKIIITLKNVIKEVAVELKPPASVKYELKFQVAGESDAIANKIEVYKGTIQYVSDYNYGYFTKEGKIFSGTDGLLGPVDAVKTQKYYFAIDLSEDLVVDAVTGVTCSIIEGGVAGESVKRLDYDVWYLDELLEFNKKALVFEITKLDTQTITIGIGGIYYQRNVTFGTGDTAIVEVNGVQLRPEEKTVSVPYGKPLKLKVTPATGYYFDGIQQIQILEQATEAEVNFAYELDGEKVEITVENVTKDLLVNINFDKYKTPITFNKIEGIQYYGASYNGEEVTVDKEKTINGIMTVDREGDYYFAVKADAGYDIEELVLKGHGDLGSRVDLIDEGYAIFKIEMTDSVLNVSITGTIPKLKYTVTFKVSPVEGEAFPYSYQQDGVEIGSSLDVVHGNSVFFQVKLKEEYNQSDLKVQYSYREGEDKVTRQLSMFNGAYSITDITDNIEVSVYNVSVNQYVINFTAAGGANYMVEDGTITSGTQLVTHNEDYSFGIEAQPGYALGTEMIVNCKRASGVKESLTPDLATGKYTIKFIKENCTISIENVGNLEYAITLVPVEGVTYYNDTGAVIYGKFNIKYGQNFEFEVSVASAYDDSVAGMYISVDKGQSGVTAQKLASGRYIIPNVMKDISVEVGGIAKNRYTVTLTKIEGIDYLSTNGKIITGDVEVEHKESLIFKVYLYPAYADSKITVQLGDNTMTSSGGGVYTISGIEENKTVTVLGVETTKEVEVINKINSLPSSIKDLSDADLVIEASKMYNSLSDKKKESVTNISELEKLQEELRAFHHTSNGVTVDNLDWYIKLIANPISSDAQECARIYKKLGSEYILLLYDIYLWDTLNDRRYYLPEGHLVNITFPMPDTTYFKNFTGIHENSSDGKLEFLTLTLKNTVVSFTTGSFSAMGVVADRSATPGRSSLLDAMDANVGAIKDYAFATYSSGSSADKDSAGTTVINPEGSGKGEGLEEITGNISEKFKGSSNKVTAAGSALRLTLVLMILILIAVAIWIVIKNRNKINEKNGN